MKTLADLKIGESGVVKRINSDPTVKRNVMSNGMIRGSTVTLTGQAPFGDPLIYQVNSSKISLRRVEAETITLVEE